MRGGRDGRFSGVANNENLYTAFLFLAGTLCDAAAVAFSENALYREYGLLHGKACRISAVSLWVALFQGTQPVINTVSKETTEPFRIPALWALCMICFFLMIGLAVEEMRGAAYQRILREGSRAKWAGRICCKITARVLLWYACIGGSVVLLAFCLGGTWVPGDRGVFLLISGVPEELWSPVYLCAALWLSVLAMLAMAFFQAVICLLVSPMMGIVCSVAALAASVFWHAPFLPGEYLQFVRMKPDELLPGVCTMSLILAGSVFLIFVRVRKMDFRTLFLI